MFHAMGITALAGMGGTGLGGGLACLWSGESRRATAFLLNYAAGVMLAVVCLDLLPDAANQSGGFAIAMVGLLSGCGLAVLLHLLLDQHPKPNRRLLTTGWVTAAAIALHNLPEGMAIGASFAADSRTGGLLMAAVIGLHNVPEGMAIAAPLVSGGLHRRQAVWTAALSGLPTVPGAALGYLIGTMHPLALALSLSLAAGAMLYVVFGELLPEAARLSPEPLPSFGAILGVVTGFLMLHG